MIDFLNAVSDFLGSDLAKEHTIIIIVLAFVLVVVTVFVTSIVFNKLIFPTRIRGLEDIQEKYQEQIKKTEELEKEISKLKSDLKEYKITKGIIDAVKGEKTQKQESDDGLAMRFLRR